MSTQNYIPDSDSDYDDFVQLFSSFVDEQTPGSVTPAMTTPLAAKVAAWKAAYAAHKTAQTAATAAATLKDNARAALTGDIRPIAQIMQNDPTVTDTQRQQAGLPVLATTRTRAPVPTTRPIGQVDTSMRLQHTLSWRDEATPTSRAKPNGVQGVEIWAYVGPAAPTSPGQCHFVAVDSSSPYLLVHDAADAGKTVHYMMRWMNTRNEAGPWSETLSATIGA